MHLKQLCRLPPGYVPAPRIWRYLNTELVDDDYLRYNARFASKSKHFSVKFKDLRPRYAPTD